MDEISTSQLKVHCSNVVSEVARTRSPVTVTRRGRPVARIVPLDDEPVSLFGALRGSVVVNGDLLEPIDVEWEVER